MKDDTKQIRASNALTGLFLGKKQRSFYKIVVAILLLLGAASFKGNDVTKKARIILAKQSPRTLFGKEQLEIALKKEGYQIIPGNAAATQKGITTIYIGGFNYKQFARLAAGSAAAETHDSIGKEGFHIQSTTTHDLTITGTDETGTLYGCLELVDRLKKEHQLPTKIDFKDQPEMVLRGACIGVQKPYYLPGRTVYEYPYTPETFPWFYDKKLWINYLDSLVNNRMNSLYLWNGHPFASLVRLKEYPYAVEVDDATLKKNEELFHFLTTEADKRGIWVIQMFYNIIVSKPFAEKNNLKTQDRNRPIIPIIADYTRKSIAAFVAKYPNVGLMVALGEAMEGAGPDDVEWFTKTIIPGVKDGLKAIGKTEEPPIVLRSHDTDPKADIDAALPLYKNLYTESKYNGESLTTYTPRGPWAELHRKLASFGTVQIENVHILANLEPFRYGAASFIQKCVVAMHDVHHGNGLHLYPQASYWDWPYAADNTNPRLLQIDRDWIWYKEWSRYAWNCHRDPKEEINYWSSQIANRYDCGNEAGKNILTAYEETGEIAPKLLRRFGITDGNRQTLTLGMLMIQLVNPARFNQIDLLYNSEGPEGETLQQYAAKELNHEPHIGETPVQIIEEVKNHATKAALAIEKARAFVLADKAEFSRVANDIHCYNALAFYYAYKAEAALAVLRYQYSKDINDLKMAYDKLGTSINYFKELTKLTATTYLYANSMQTKQRKIPVGGNDGKNKTWTELLPIYENEYAKFGHKIDSLEHHPAGDTVQKITLLKNAVVTIQSKTEGRFVIAKGATVFPNDKEQISKYAKELAGLNGVLLSKEQMTTKGVSLSFTNARPVKVLVGFFDQKEGDYLPPPQLETDASANDYGQGEVKIANSVLVSDMPVINIRTYSFPAGSNKLTLGKGICLILGFVEEQQTLPVYDAGFSKNASPLDWLFN